MASIDQPASSVTVAPGEAVEFLGSASDPDGELPLTLEWTFPVGVQVPAAEQAHSLREVRGHQTALCRPTVDHPSSAGSPVIPGKGWRTAAPAIQDQTLVPRESAR